VRFDDESNIEPDITRRQYDPGQTTSRGVPEAIATASGKQPIIINNYYGPDNDEDDPRMTRASHARISKRRPRSRSPSPPPIPRTDSRERSYSPPLEIRTRSKQNPFEREIDWNIYDDTPGSRLDAYSFRLSRHVKSPLSRESSVGSLSDASEPNQAISSSPPIKGLSVAKILHVTDSKYSGDGTIGGLQSVEMKAQDEKGSQPLFSWV